VRADFSAPGVGEEADAGALQGGGRALFASRQERARESIGEELRYNRRLGDDFILVEEARHVVGDGGDEAARVQVKVPLRARGGEVDNYFLVGQVQFGEGDVGAVGEWAAVVGVDGDFGWERAWVCGGGGVGG